MKNSILLLFFVLTVNESTAQWTKVNGIPGQDIVAITSMADTLFAASGTNLIYKSFDSGITWNVISITSQTIEIYSLEIIGNEIYIGTVNSGIYKSSDYGATWTNYNSTLPAVSGFEKFGNTIYASTVGNGVYMFDPVNNNWISFNNQLPVSLSYNVEAITGSSTGLIIAAGANGTFYVYDFFNNQWVLGYYYGNLLPGLSISEIICYSDTLFATNGQRIIRSNNAGFSWTDDKTGSHNGDSRNIFAGSDNIFTLTNLITGGTWIQKRTKTAGIGSAWNIDEEFFFAGYSYDIFEFKGKLFLARMDGLYFRSILQSLNVPADVKNEVFLYPNPAGDDFIQLHSTAPMHKISVYNIMGQIIHEEFVGKSYLELDNKFETGIYTVHVYFDYSKFKTLRLIVD